MSVLGDWGLYCAWQRTVKLTELMGSDAEEMGRFIRSDEHCVQEEHKNTKCKSIQSPFIYRVLL